MLARSASADPTSPTSPSAPVEPPRLLFDPGVSYPDAAIRAGHLERVEVVLIVHVDLSGNVVEARVETPSERDFEAAALEAARQLRFSPALRGGVPVAARIKFAYRFEPPPPIPASPVVADEEAPAAVVAKEADPASPPEVTVRGERRAPAVLSYTREEVRRIPGAFGDPFRAIETLPGVTPVASGLPFFYVRGAPPGNVGYFLDGIRVPYLYHVGFGPSVISPAIVERVDLYPGGYPARFGRFAGGIVSAEATAPRGDLHGEATLRLFDVGGLAEGGFANGRGTALVGGRYSYTAALLSLVSPSIRLDYRDYQARFSYALTPKDSVSLFGFGAYDLLGQEKNGDLDILFGTEFYRGALRHEHRFERGALTTTLHAGYDRSSAAFIAGERRNVATRSLGATSELDLTLSERTRLRAGADAIVEAHAVEKPRYFDEENPETRDFAVSFPPRSDTTIGTWLDAVFDLGSVELTPGLRADLYGSGGARRLALDPRIAARFFVSDRVRIIHAYGMAHQRPSFVLPVPGLTPATLADGLQESLQVSAGVEVALDAATEARATVFYNAFFDMSDALGTSGGGGPPDTTARGDGRAFGAELYLKRSLSAGLGGFLSYTLSRSERSSGGETFPSSFDRSHVINAALSYDLGRGWTSGARVMFYSGAPVQPDSGNAIIRRTQSAAREPAFFRLDLRLEKRWRLATKSSIAVVAEVMNATLSKENFGGEPVGPIVLPSLGAELSF